MNSSMSSTGCLPFLERRAVREGGGGAHRSIGRRTHRCTERPGDIRPCSSTSGFDQSLAPSTHQRVARILVCEDYPALRDLFGQIVTLMGHEISFYDAANPAVDAPADLLILEPADPAAREWAHRRRLADPDLPIICVSRRSLRQFVEELAPTAYLVKPATVTELEQAIAAGLSPRFGPDA